MRLQSFMPMIVSMVLPAKHIPRQNDKTVEAVIDRFFAAGNICRNRLAHGRDFHQYAGKFFIAIMTVKRYYRPSGSYPLHFSYIPNTKSFLLHCSTLRLGKILSGGKDGILGPLLENLLNRALVGEMDSHLSQKDPDIGNRRNGYICKHVQTPMGEITINTPRDRESTFDPQIIHKREEVPCRFPCRPHHRPLRYRQQR